MTSLSDALASTALMLSEQAQELRQRASKLQAAAARCRTRIASGELDGCTVRVPFRNNEAISIEAAEALAAELAQEANGLCDQIRDQLDQDLKAMERQRQAIERCQEDLEEWTKRNEEAQREALGAAIDLLVDGTLGMAAETTHIINGLQGAIVKYEKQLQRQKKSIDPFQMTKLTDLNKRQLTLHASAEAAKALQKEKKRMQVAWGEFTATTREIDEQAGSLMDEVQGLSEDPIFEELLRKEGLMPLVRKLKTRKLFPKKPYMIEVGEFFVDYGYHATDWWTSRNQILQRYELTEQQLQAIDSLKAQIERTTAALNNCRGGFASGQGSDATQQARSNTQSEVCARDWRTMLRGC